MNYCPLARTSDFVEQASGDDILVYDLKSNKAICLNESVAIIWKLSDGNRSVSEIAVEVGKELKSSVNEDFVLLALDQLNNEGLLARGFRQNTKFVGLSRREVIRKIGIGAMVALPVVSSIVAPGAINAQSDTCHTSGTCIAAGQDLCPPGCTQSSIAVDFHSTTDGSCGGTTTPNAAIFCSNGSFSIAVDVSID